MPSLQCGYEPAALDTRLNSFLPQLPCVYITGINLGRSLPLLTYLCLVLPSNGTHVWLKKPGHNLLSIYGTGRKRQERRRLCPTKSRQTPFFPGFRLTWQLFLTNFPLLLPNSTRRPYTPGTDFGCTQPSVLQTARPVESGMEEGQSGTPYSAEPRPEAPISRGLQSQLACPAAWASSPSFNHLCYIIFWVADL